MTAPIAINARAAMRAEVGGVERVTKELVARLPALAPDRYRVVAPPPRLAHRAGHTWEQLALPVVARGAELVFSPANTAPLAGRRNAVLIHDLAPLVEPDWYGKSYGAWHRTLLRATARRAKLAITPSEFVRGQLTELLGMPADHVVAVPMGVDPAFGAIDPDAKVEGRQDDLHIDLIAVTSIPGTVLRHRLRLLAGNAWELRDVSAA